MALVSVEVYEWLQTVIKADATLATLMGGTVRCFQRNAPEGTPVYPFVLIRWVSGIPLMTISARDVYTNALVDVFVVTRDNSTAGIKAIANRLDAILNRASGTTADGDIFFVHKAEMTEIATTDPPSPGGGARVQNLGRTWRLIVGAG